MAGHSQFKNIMHRKGRQDAVRSKMFSKLAREITVAAKTGMADPAMNPRLRLAIQNAKAQSMPKDNIERAIKKASGGDSENYDEVRYEGYAPGGVAVIVEALTDNRNRTAGDMRSTFAKNGGALGETNSVSFQFERLGAIRYPAAAASADAMLEAAIEAGAADVDSSAVDAGEEHEIRTSPDDLFAVRDALEARLGPAESARLEWRPTVTVALDDEEQAAAVIKLLDALEEHDDVQQVYANFEVPEAVMQRLSA